MSHFLHDDDDDNDNAKDIAIPRFFSENSRAKNEPCLVKRGLDAFAKRIGPGQPAQSAQADLGRTLSQSIIKSFFFIIFQTFIEISKSVQAFSNLDVCSRSSNVCICNGISLSGRRIMIMN